MNANVDVVTPTALALPAAPVVFFDGVCNLCSAFVQFILANELSTTLRFASLQSPLAQQVLPGLGVDPANLDSVVFVVEGVAYQKSDAALRVARWLKAPWRFGAALLWVPRVLRDLGYDLVASNRYRLWGKKDACWLPTPEFKARFL
jgi:predicted DCC family thiol-disulfide oxidoreductase YuxK